MPYLIVIALMLSACTRTVYQTELVEVPGPIRYRVVPAYLLAPCLNGDAPSTNGELLQSWERLRAQLAICDTQIKAIKEFGESDG